MIRPKRGRDLTHIKEQIFDNPTFNKKLADHIEQRIADLDPQPGQWRNAWEQIKTEVRAKCEIESEALRKRATRKRKK